jgi:putative tryptophan/tyrosine transport system substrate-binding protein
MKRSLGLRAGMLLSVCVAGIVGFSTLAHAIAPNTFDHWFKVGASANLHWTVSAATDDGLQVSIKPKRLVSSRPLRRILVLYPRPSSAYDTAITRFLAVFADKRIDAELLVVNFNNEDAKGRTALALAEESNYDLVLAMGSESTAWLWSTYKGGRLPVVSLCSKDPVLLGQMSNYVQGSGNNFAFTSLNMPIDAQMSYVTQLLPNLKNFAILVDANNVSAMQTQALPAKKFARERGIRVFELAVKNSNNAKTELAVLVRDAVNSMKKNDTDLSNSIFWITGSTTVFAEIATINAHAFRVPVLSTVTDVVTAGDDTAAVSVGVSFESNAYQSALYAADILDGQRKPGDLPVGIVSPPDVAISFKKAREIGLRIPFPLFEGATVIYNNDGNLARSSSSYSPATATESANTPGQAQGNDGRTPIAANPPTPIH